MTISVLHVNLVIIMAELTKYLLVAQWLERSTCIWEVMGLNLSFLLYDQVVGHIWLPFFYLEHTYHSVIPLDQWHGSIFFMEVDLSFLSCFMFSCVVCWHPHATFYQNLRDGGSQPEVSGMAVSTMIMNFAECIGYFQWEIMRLKQSQLCDSLYQCSNVHACTLVSENSK